MQSESIADLAAALSRAQGQITGALKDSANPFFKSRYADLASCWDACRSQLSANGLSVIQTTDVTEAGLVLVTTLAHASGQWVRSVLPVKAKDDGPQAQGSGITYARRYALAAIVGLAQIDDDAEAAQARAAEQPRNADKMAEPSKVDTRKANAYSKRITEAVGADNDELLRELMAEVKEAGQDFRIAVWSTLSTPIKNRVKDVAKESA